MWDPPKANYIGLNSEVCTPYQQHLAYALKHLLLSQPEQVKKELGRVGHRRGEEQVAAMARMVQGLAENNDAWFAEGLVELLFWHHKDARKSHRQTDPERFFSLAGVGLSILSVRRGLLKKSELPDDPYLPLELIPD
jgi:hypothetical protein